MAKKKSNAKRIFKTAVKNLQKRGVQVLFVIVLGLFLTGLSHRWLAPKEKLTEAERAAQEKEYKFMHCDRCNLELSYDATKVNKPCSNLTCQPPNVGYFRATRGSIKSGTEADPLRWFYTAAGFIFIATLAAVVFLAYKPPKEFGNRYYVTDCQHCGQRLRFREVSLGNIGQCPRCKKILRFPDEDDAMREDVAEEWEKEQVKMRLAELERDGD